MPFQSSKQMRWMFANKPEMARHWVSDAKASGQPVVKKTKKKKVKKRG